MKYARLLHNPGAGTADHSLHDIVNLIEAEGYKCSYSSTNEVTKKDVLADDNDVIVLAGGDGTIRKAAKELLSEGVPIGLLPMGTANNIAKTLGISGGNADIIESWNKKKTKLFDVGVVGGLDEVQFFLESFGFGLFPLLMQKMHAVDSSDDPQDKLNAALTHAIDIARSMQPFNCSIVVDGEKHEGLYLLVEVLNTRSFGPNLTLAPKADPGDHFFDVVLIPESQRSACIEYLTQRSLGEEPLACFFTLRGKDISLQAHATECHIDDECRTVDASSKINIHVSESALEFLIQ